MNRTIKIYYYDTFEFNQNNLNNFKKKNNFIPTS